MWLVVASAASLLVACGDDDGGSATTAATAATSGAATTAASTTAAATTMAPETTGAPASTAGATTAPAGTNAPSGEPLKIGFAADYGELGAFSDQPITDALNYLVGVVNGNGGVNGTPIELTVKPINGDPEATQRAVQELLDAGVSAILGPPFTDLGFPLLTQTGGSVPVLSVASTDPALGDTSKNSFITAFSDYAQGSAAAEYALEQGKTNAITFTTTEAPYFVQTTGSFAKRFSSGGGSVTDFTFSLADTDFSTQVNEIAGMDPKPDVLYTAMVMPNVATLLGQLKSAGVDVMVIGSDAFDATGVASAGGDAEGVLYTAHAFPSPGSAFEEFLTNYEADTGKKLETTSFGALAADALGLIIDAYTRAGSTDPAAISAALAETENLEGLTGSITFKGTTGTPTKPVFLVQITNGAPALVESFTPTEVAIP
jgi:branched-chain amino acid transport system substrate-binding protein